MARTWPDLKKFIAPASAASRYYPTRRGWRTRSVIIHLQKGPKGPKTLERKAHRRRSGLRRTRRSQRSDGSYASRYRPRCDRN